MRKWMLLAGKVAAVLVAVLLLLGTLALTYLEFADLGKRHALIESIASNAIGRPVHIDGPVRLDLGRHLEIQAEHIRLGNAPWSPEPDMLDVRDAHLVIETRSLFSGPLRFSRVSIGRAAIIVERSADLELNWNLAAADQGEAAPKPAMNPRTVPVVIEHLDAGNISLIFRGPALKNDVPMIIGQITINESSTNTLEMTASGILAGSPWSLKGNLGTVASLVTGKQIHTSLQMDFNSARLAIETSAESLADIEGVIARLEFDGPELSLIIDPLGLPEIAQGEFHLNAMVTASGDTLQASLDARAGELFADIDLSGNQLGEPEPVVDAEIRARGANLGAISALLGLPGLEEKPFSLSGKFHREAGNTLFDDIVLDAPNTRLSLTGELTQAPAYVGTRVRLQAHVPNTAALVTRFGVHWLHPGSASLKASLEQSDSGLSLSSAELELGNTRLLASGTIGSLENLDGTRLNLELDTANAEELGQLISQAGWPGLPLQATTILEISSGQWRLTPKGAQLGAATVNTTGFVKSVQDGLQAELGMELDIPSMKPFGNTLGLPELPDLPLRGSSSLVLAGQEIQLTKTSLDLGMMTLGGSATVTLDGESGYQLASSLEAQGANFLKAAQYAGIDNVPEQAWKASARISGSEQKIQLDKLELELGDTRIRGQGEYLPGLTGSHGRFEAQGPDARTLHPSLQEVALQALPFKINAELTRSASGIRLQGLQGALAGLTLDSSGSVGDWPEFKATDLKFSLKAPDLATTLKNWSTAVGPSAAFELSGQLRASAGELTLNADSRIGADSLRLEGHLGTQAPRTFRIEASGTELDLDRLAELWPAEKQAPDKGSARVIPDLKFPDTWPETLTGTASIELGVLDQGGMQFKDLRLEGKLDKHLLDIHTFRALLGGGQISGTFKARPVDNGVQADMTLSARDTRFNLLPGNLDSSARSPFDVDATFGGRGKGLRELVGSLDGKMAISEGKGEVLILNSAFTNDLLAELTRLLNPLKQSSTVTVMECGLIIANVQDGLLTTDIAMYQTNRLLVTSQASVNLKNEHIEVLFNIMSREGMGVSATSIVNPYVKLTGTLGKPALAFAPTRAAISYGAAVATGGLSLLAKGFWDRLASSGKQCENELASRGMRLPGT